MAFNGVWFTRRHVIKHIANISEECTAEKLEMKMLYCSGCGMRFD